MTEEHSLLALIFGGIAVFMMGMNLASDNLQKIAANRIRSIVTTLAQKPVWGVLLGILLTMILQSSGATTTLLVGLGSTGVVTLPQVMSVILGAAVGSTFTVQILSFNISQFGFSIFSISFFAFFFAKKRMVKNVAAVFMGFGLLLFGLDLVRMGTEELRNLDFFKNFVRILSDNPIYAVLLTSIFTAAACSSTVTISLAMLLTAHGILSLEDSVYWIFGANIGTTATALIAAAGGNYVGRQVAWAHALYKAASVAIFFPLVHVLTVFLSTGAAAHDVANINTIYNLIAAIVFLPFVKKGAELVQTLFPPGEFDAQYSVKYLKRGEEDPPQISVARAEREALRMADVVTSMIEDSIKMFASDNTELIDNMRIRDDKADLLARELNLYLAQQLDQAPEGLRNQMLKLMYFVTDLEAAADVVDNQMIELAQKKTNLRMNFSSEGWTELEEIYRAVLRISQMSVACFQTQDSELATKIVFHKRNVRRLEQKMRESHISRLVKGKAESIVTSSIHFDVLSEYRRIAGLMANHVYSLLKESDPQGILSRRDHL